MFRTYSESICRTGVKTKTTPVNQVFTCDICEEGSWLTETDVELHRKSNHYIMINKQMKESPSRFCTICMRLQPSEAELISHIKSRHLLSSPQARRIERETFICNYCQRIFFNKDMLIIHIKRFHFYNRSMRKGKRYCCPICTKMCLLTSIWCHMIYTHEIPSVTACDICLMNTPSTKHLFKHLNQHPSYYKCDTCGIVMSRDKNYETHLDKHWATEFTEKPLYGLLDRVFKKPAKVLSRYNIHDALKGLELPKPIRICTLCREICHGIVEAQSHLLRDHLQPSRTSPPNKFACTCGAEFNNRVLIRHHVFKQKGAHKHVADLEKPVPEDQIETEVLPQTEETQLIDSPEPAEATAEEIPNNDLTYVMAEIEVKDQEMVTVDSETQEEIVGF